MNGVGDHWRPTPSLLAAAGVTAGVLLLAVLLRRPDLVVIAAPFAVGTAFALAGPRAVRPVVQLGLDTERGQVWEGDEVPFTVTLTVADGIDAAVVRIAQSMQLPIEGADLSRCVRPASGDVAGFTVTGRSGRWGRWSVGPATVSLTSAGGLLRCETDARATALVSVQPLWPAFGATDAMPDAAGMVGGHRSRRAGEGGDLIALRPFVSGDRLRRVSWPASLRTGELHVRATTEDRDADVQLVVDTWSDVALADGASTLDSTVRAAASLAEHYLAAGDRVALFDVGRPTRPVALGASRRHMGVVLSALLAARPRTADPDVAARAVGLLRTRGLVIVLSTLLSEPIESVIAALARRGGSVLVLDTLPERADVPTDTEATALAWQLALLRRDTLADSLAERGIPMARWRGAGSLNAILQRMTALSRAPRKVR